MLIRLTAAAKSTTLLAMIYLRSLVVRPWPERLNGRFPFFLPLIQGLDGLVFRQPVTFFVGENGTGKSTLLEALACAIDSITVGAEPVRTDQTLADVRALSQYLKLVWAPRTRKGFFLRAEDFFGYARRQAQIQAEMRAELDRVDEEYRDRSDFARGLARMPFSRELSDMRGRYGDGLDSISHGEAFLKLFESRFNPGGLYLLDEPEAPLSPLRQLAFLASLKQMIALDSQFIIATHSPLILAFPDADIIQFDNGRLSRVAYEELEHVRLTRDFLQNPAAFLRHL